MKPGWEIDRKIKVKAEDGGSNEIGIRTCEGRLIILSPSWKKLTEAETLELISALMDAVEWIRKENAAPGGHGAHGEPAAPHAGKISFAVNLNARCEVVLTKEGATRLNDRPGSVRQVYFPGATYSTSLWDLMHDFGPDLQIGLEKLPFKDNRIVIEGEAD